VTKPLAATPDPKNGGRKRRSPKLRDGVMKRGSTWYYVIRVRDPETGESKPKWVGGFATEDEAKAARDEARVKARRGEYVDRNAVSVGEYLDEWIEAHAVEIKPKTLKDYKYIIDRYVKPHIGGQKLQAVRPATITKLYRDLMAGGGKNGRQLSPRTIDYVHAVLRKAFRDAVEVDQVLASNPVERAKRPRRTPAEPGTVWTAEQLRTFLAVARQHRLFAFFHLAAYTGARRGELLNLRWSDVDLDPARSPSPARRPSSMGSASRGQPRPGEAASCRSTQAPSECSKSTGGSRRPTSSLPVSSGAAPMTMCSRPDGVNRSTRTRCHLS